MGSVSDGLVRTAGVPVLIVPTEDGAVEGVTA
jgi:nucleotide-binding universal stress UspA family protein